MVQALTKSNENIGFCSWSLTLKSQYNISSIYISILLFISSVLSFKIEIIDLYRLKIKVSKWSPF